MKELKGGLFSQPIPCQLQLEATRIRDAYADDLHGYPWQVLVDGYGQGRADLDTLRTVREAMRKTGTTSVSTLREEVSTWKFAMQEDLSEIQLEYVFLEMVKNVDLHHVLLQLEALEAMITVTPTMEVTTMGVAGAIVGACTGPAMAVFLCPLLAVMGGALGDLLVASKAPAYALVGWTPTHPFTREAARRLEIDLELENFQEAREKFQQQVLQAMEDAKDSKKHVAQIADWQLLRHHYANVHPRCTTGSSEPRKEVGIYVYVMKTRGHRNEDWKLVRSWFGEALNASVSETETQKIEAFTLYM